MHGSLGWCESSSALFLPACCRPETTPSRSLHITRWKLHVGVVSKSLKNLLLRRTLDDPVQFSFSWRCPIRILNSSSCLSQISGTSCRRGLKEFPRRANLHQSCRQQATLSEPRLKPMPCLHVIGWMWFEFIQVRLAKRIARYNAAHLYASCTPNANMHCAAHAENSVNYRTIVTGFRERICAESRSGLLATTVQPPRLLPRSHQICRKLILVLVLHSTLSEPRLKPTPWLNVISQMWCEFIRTCVWAERLAFHQSS